MENVLATIIDEKHNEVRALAAATSFTTLDQAAKAASPVRGFAAALARDSADGYGLIAELKKASPSKGLIRADFDPASLAKAYEDGGASCLSVLTDRKWFQGAPEFLVAARDAVTLPVLRKDFMIDPLQIVESRALGADCILLIMAALDDALAAELESVAFDYGMDVLIECHDSAELARATKLLGRMLSAVDAHMEGRDYLAGAFSGADIMTGHACTVSRRLGADVSDKPNVEAYIERGNARPAMQRAWAA